jgi:triosephosphate isomerase
LLSSFVQKLKKTKIDVGAQNCHQSDINGPFTGSINSKMIKNLGCSYVIIGHSENRINGDDNSLINKKIKVSLNNNLKILFCIGETLKEKKTKKTKIILTNQIIIGLKKIKNIKKIIFAYEPVWSIGTGIIPKQNELINNIVFIKKLLKKRFKYKNPKVLYGGSVNPKNINELRQINQIDGFLIGGSSQNSNKFIDIIKKTFN